MLIANPRCEWQVQPVTDITRPRLTWELSSAVRGDLQTAYQVQCGSTVGASDLWDSGKVMLVAQLVSYAGSSLPSRKTVYWQVRVWDAAGVASQWKSSFFEIGLLLTTDWSSAVWIGLVTGPVSSSSPAACARKTFTLPAKTIVRGRLYATARGLYRPFLNGNRVGQVELAPGWTDYAQRHQYQTYDVTTLLVSGQTNALGLMIGDGWAVGLLGTGQVSNRNYYFSDAPRVLCVLYVDYSDGTSSVIPSDNTWKATTAGDQMNDIYLGETFDGTRSFSFSDPAQIDSGWPLVSTVALTSATLTAQPCAPVRRQETLLAKAISNPSAGTYIFDFGQNHSGITQLTVRGAAASQVVKVRHGEDLLSNGSGTLYTANLRTAVATDAYTCVGAAVEVFEPLHTYHGYRYASVTGYPGTPKIDALRSVVISADNPRTGSFRCSSVLLTAIWSAAYWSHRSNAMSILTDCNQRDEREGWTGDLQLTSDMIPFMHDNIAMLQKMAIDLDQSASGGRYGDTAPFNTAFYRGIAAWASAGIIVPWNAYQLTGDKSILSAHYMAMQAGLAAEPLGNKYGDYLNIADATNASVFVAAYAYLTATIVTQAATILGDSTTQSSAAAKASGFATTWAGYVGSDGTVLGNSQAGYVLGLAFGLIPTALIPAAIGKLVALLTANGPTVGFIGLKYLFDVLSDNGQEALAFSLAQSTAYPAVGYSISQGVTTTPEQPNPIQNQSSSQNSYNHIVRGTPAGWMTRRVAGIAPDPAAPGYGNVLMRPIVGNLRWAEASFLSPRGLIESKWNATPLGMQWRIVLPPGSTATITLPAGYASILEQAAPVVGASATTTDPINGRPRFALASGTYNLFVK